MAGNRAPCDLCFHREHWPALLAALTMYYEAERFIRTHEAPAKATIGKFAQTIGVSRGTMRGYLADAGVHWEKLRDRILHDMTNDLLKTMPASAVCMRLGYSDTSVLYRCYRRWTGYSIKEAPKPLTWRQE